MIVLILYINLLNLSWLRKFIFEEHEAFNLQQRTIIDTFLIFPRKYDLQFILIISKGKIRLDNSSKLSPEETV